MDDRELLELAAKAAGFGLVDEIGIIDHCETRGFWANVSPGLWTWWNPIASNSDAFMLAVKLGMPIQHGGSYVAAYAGKSVMAEQFTERHEKDPYAATRRAIVRAAAEIGKAMK